MKIRKIVQGQIVDLELVKIKDYSRYTLYQVYKLVNGNRIPIYKTTYTKLQMKELVKSNLGLSIDNIFLEEVFE